MPSEKEIQSIKLLQEELDRDQIIQVGLKSDNTKVDQIINKASVAPAIYTDPERLDRLISELEELLSASVKASGNRGKLLGKSTIQRFMEEQERRQITQKTLAQINQLNERQAQQRLALYIEELKKEAAIFKADISIFKKNAQLAGFSTKDAVRQLVQAANDKTGLAQGFAKKVKSVQVAAVRREKFESKTQEMLKVAKKGERWTWITVSTKPCPDCTARAGVSLPYQRWQEMGVPGAGRTICGTYCRCQLVPNSVADDQFPTIRRFDYKPADTVLATKSELRAFNAKSNQSKNVSKRVKPEK